MWLNIFREKNEIRPLWGIKTSAPDLSLHLHSDWNSVLLVPELHEGNSPLHWGI